MADKRYRDEAFLRDRYINKGCSTYDIADECGASKATILYWLDKHGIETREPNGRSDLPVFSTNPTTGYERVRWNPRGDDRREITIHRLSAVAWFGWEAVVEKDIHHVNNIPWDNREENIEPLTHGEHSRITRRADLEQYPLGL